MTDAIQIGEYNMIRIGSGTSIHAAYKGGSGNRALCGANQGMKSRRPGRVVAPVTDWTLVTCARCRGMR